MKNTIACYFCDGEPQRKIISEKVNGDRQDPTMVYTLECGHKVI